jgi:uncharacterized membrane protein YfcA
LEQSTWLDASGAIRMDSVLFVLIGLGAGVLSGLFGIGGGVLIVPALLYGVGFTQKMATGTSLAVLLPPVGVLAVVEYYRQGQVNFKAAILIALSLMLGAWIGARGVSQLDSRVMKSLFGLFLIVLGCYVFWDGQR